MKQIQYKGIECAWKNAFNQPIKDRESKIYLSMLCAWMNLFEWHDCKRSTKRRNALAHLSFHGKLTDAQIHECEIEEIHEDLMLERARKSDEIVKEFDARIKREIDDKKSKGTWIEVLQTQNNLPDWKAYLVESATWNPEIWDPIVKEINDLQPYILGTPNAQRLDEIGESMRFEHKRRDRIYALKRSGIDFEIAHELMCASIKHAQSAIYKIENGHPIGKPVQRKSKGASAKTDENENQKIKDEHGLIGFKKPIEIGSMSIDDAMQCARLCVLNEWMRIKHAFKRARKLKPDFVDSNQNLKRHFARMAYRSALRDLTSWDGWRQKGWLESKRDDAIEKEILNAKMPVFDERIFVKSKPRWVKKLNEIALKKGLLKTKDGKREHKKFVKMIEHFLKGRNPGRRSDHLQKSLKRYGIVENTFRKRQIDRLEKWAPFHKSIGQIERAKCMLERAKKLKKQKGKSMESYLCNMPELDS